MTPLRLLKLGLLVAALVLAACLDPLYEDGAPLTSAYAPCCREGLLTTCYCPDPTRCLQTIFACPEGRCSLTPACYSGTQDAGSVGGGGGSSAGGGAGGGGGASGGGAGGGSADAGNPLDGGTQDAGSTGGGAGGGTGGGATGGGTGGGSGGGGGSGTGYEFCCVDARLTTCQCPLSGCLHEPFTSCPGGACVAGTTTSLCR